MFTGIVEELGTIRAVKMQAGNIRLAVQAVLAAQDCRIGDSVCVNGVCLTVVKEGQGIIEFDVLAETAGRSNIGLLKTGHKVNLERALKAGQRLGGHFVSGHVDGMGTVKYKRIESSDLVLGVEVDQEILKFISVKGSVTVDGVSLTVSGLDKTQQIFQVNIIPHTVRITTIGLVKEPDKVNIEIDILARYIYNFLFSRKGTEQNNGETVPDKQAISLPEITPGFLSEHGFF